VYIFFDILSFLYFTIFLSFLFVQFFRDTPVSSCGGFSKDVEFHNIGIYYGIINLEKERSTLDGGYYIGEKLKYLDNKVISVDMKPLSKYIFEYLSGIRGNSFYILNNNLKKVKEFLLLKHQDDKNKLDDYPLVYTNKDNKLYFNAQRTEKYENVVNGVLYEYYYGKRSDNIISEYDVETEEVKNIIPEEFYPNTSVKK
jgi:hypothetical protein